MAIINGAKAQGDFAPIGATWHYSWANTSDFAELGLRQGYILLHAERDTLLQGQVCRKIAATLYSVQIADPEPREVDIAAWDPIFVYENTDTVFYFNEDLNRFLPLYVFNVEAGDTVTYRVPPVFQGQGNPEDSLFRMRITEVTTIMVDGVPLKQIHHAAMSGIGFGNEMGMPYMERTGVLNSYLLCHMTATTTSSYSPVIRCYADTVVNYVLDAGIPCDYIPGSTGITDLEQQYQNLSIYPNPVQEDWLQVQLKTNPGKTMQVQVYSITGACLTTKTSQDDQQLLRVYVGDLPPGIYQLQVNCDGETIGKGRFVKQ